MRITLDEARETAPRLIEIRRAINSRPELGRAEHETAARIERELDELGIPHRRLAGTGVAADLIGAHDGRCVGLRGDMDALPIQDERTGDLRSQIQGVMHACGHDSHVTCVLGAARLLKAHQAELHGRVRFIFQPDEEDRGGARPMIEEGVAESPKVDAFFGLHADPSCEVGHVRISAGSTHAASDMFDIEITGPGGHGAHPDGTVDIILVACKVVEALQSIVSRNVPPLDAAVVTVGALNAGTQRNIIPNRATLSGIVRTMTRRARDIAVRRVREITDGICATFGAGCSVLFTPSYPVLVNDDAMTDLARGAAARLLGEGAIEEAETSLGVEDFAYFAETAPSCFFDLGVRNEARGIVHALHTSRFDIDEAALPIGAALLANCAIDALERGR